MLEAREVTKLHKRDCDDVFLRRVPTLRATIQAHTYNINDPSGGQRHPRSISRRSDAVEMYLRRKTDNHETTFVTLRAK